jgi:hypothetical protein
MHEERRWEADGKVQNEDFCGPARAHKHGCGHLLCFHNGSRGDVNEKWSMFAAEDTMFMEKIRSQYVAGGEGRWQVDATAASREGTALHCIDLETRCTHVCFLGRSAIHYSDDD